MADFATLETDVTELEDVVPSVVAIIEGIAVAIDEAVAANDAGDKTKIDSLSGRVRAVKDVLANAAVTNTPAAPEG